MKKIFTLGSTGAVAALALLLVPVVTFAQAADIGYFDNFFIQIQDLINDILIPLVFAIAILTFFWGVITYFILGVDDEGKRDSGRKLMLYGIIGFVVMVSLYGVIEILQDVFGVGGGGTVTLPGVEVRP